MLQTLNTSNTSSTNGAAICLKACRQYTPAQPLYQPRCNTWNWCNATACTYAVNTTSNLTLTGQTCQLGYSEDAALNKPVGEVNTNMSGRWLGEDLLSFCCAFVQLPVLSALDIQMWHVPCGVWHVPCAMCHVSCARCCLPSVNSHPLAASAICLLIARDYTQTAPHGQRITR